MAGGVRGAVDESAYAAAIASTMPPWATAPGRGAAGAAAPGHPAGSCGTMRWPLLPEGEEEAIGRFILHS